MVLPSVRFGPGEPGHLVVRVVPRHDAQQHADRTAPDQRGALAVEQLDRLVGEELLGVVGVVLVDRRAEVDLALGLVDRLAHLAVDDLGELFFALGVQLGDLADQCGAVGDRRPPRPFAVRLAGRGDGRLDLLRRWRSGTPSPSRRSTDQPRHTVMRSFRCAPLPLVHEALQYFFALLDPDPDPARNQSPGATIATNSAWQSTAGRENRSSRLGP